MVRYFFWLRGIVEHFSNANSTTNLKCLKASGATKKPKSFFFPQNIAKFEMFSYLKTGQQLVRFYCCDKILGKTILGEVFLALLGHILLTVMGSVPEESGMNSRIMNGPRMSNKHTGCSSSSGVQLQSGDLMSSVCSEHRASF